MLFVQHVAEVPLGAESVVVEEAICYSGQLLIQSLDPSTLLSKYVPEYLSEFSVLLETGMWDEFVRQLESDGYLVYVLPSAKAVLEQSAEWSRPLHVEHLTLPFRDGKPGSLFPFQQYALNKALSAPGRFFFFNHATGCGKGLQAAAGAQELFNRGQIDVALMFTITKNKINLCREVNEKTALTAKVVDGTKTKRQAEYRAADAEVYVLNYEKADHDYAELQELIKGRRVLFILDEVQKVLRYTDGSPNRAGKGIRSLIREVKTPWVWPMSATVINSDPERFWRLFDLPKGKNPLGTLSSFRDDYSDSQTLVQTPWGTQVTYHWSTKKLAEVRHRVHHLTHVVRKTDPGVREFFKGLEFIPVPVKMSKEDRELYDLITEVGGKDHPNNWGQYYRVLRYLCNTAESLKHSESEIAQIITEARPDLSSKTSAKMSAVMELIEDMADAGEKVIVFTELTNLGLFLIEKELRRRKISVVTHHGGMSPAEAQQAQDTFRQDPSITVFLSSDAGSHGLSFQQARYVINYEIPYSYDTLLQRNSRIDRADSHLDGLTCFGFYTEDTVEERIWGINNRRRKIAASIQGSTEALSRPEPEDEELEKILFG
jgi:hypothetical protein